MKITVFLFFLLVTHIVSAQHWGRTRFTLDSLQDYSREQEEYQFVLEGRAQGLFFDSLSLVNRKAMAITVTNNSASSIFIPNYKMRDGTVLWYLDHPRKDSILPNESFSFKPQWIQRQGPFNGSITFQYTSNGETKSFILRIWGWNELPPRTVEPTTVKVEPIEPKDTAIVRIPLSEIYKKHVPALIQHKRYAGYRGEKVNRIKRNGLKNGKWVYLHEDNYLKQVFFFTDQVSQWDSAYFYQHQPNVLQRKEWRVKTSDSAYQVLEFNEQGEPFKGTLWNGKVVHIPVVLARHGNQSAKKRQFLFPKKYVEEYYREGELERYTSYNNEGDIDTMKVFYPTGVLKSVQLFYKGKPTYMHAYNEAGLLLKTVYDRNRTTRAYTYKFPNDSITERDYFYNNKFTWTEIGTFKENELWTGVRSSRSPHERFRALLFENGKQNGFIFRNEIVNQSDSNGKQGKWIEFYYYDSIQSSAHYTNDRTDSVTYYFPSGKVSGISYYYKERKVQLSHRFYQSGELLSREVFNNSDTLITTFFKSGNVESIGFRDKARTDFYYDNPAQKCPYKSVYTAHKVKANSYDDYSNHNPYTNPIGYSPTVDYYKNCTIYQRENPKSVYFRGIEGRDSHKINYTVEKGVFKNNQLHSGVREYWSAEGKLTKTKKVVGGEER